MKTHPPNLLFVYTDEQAISTMEAYGNSRIAMPNLNRLAARSTVFDQAYVTQPVCTPSRSSLLTGLYPHTNGCSENNVPLRSDTLCLPEMLTDPYVTAHHGKWHLGDEIFAQHGFQEWVSIDDGYRRYYGPERDPEQRSTYCRWLLQNGLTPQADGTFSRAQCARLPERFSKPAFLAQEASRFIREHANDPFVLYVNFFEPHMPYFGPRDDQYDPGTIPLPENFDCPPSEEQALKLRLFARAYYEKGHSGLPLKSTDDWKRLIANYWGLCSLVDTHLGTILQTLEDCGLDDNTIIVYTSDHGDMMGSHRLAAKCVMFEEATRVPLLITLPGQDTGRRISGPISQIDVVPTLLDLMDQPLPAHLQGRSRKDLLLAAAPGAQLDEDVIISWNGHNSGVTGDKGGKVNLPEPLPDWMTAIGSREELEDAVSDPVRTIVSPDGWKLTVSPRGEHELYNLAQDPGETVNLAKAPEQRARRRDLRQRLGAWQRRVDDRVTLPTF